MKKLILLILLVSFIFPKNCFAASQSLSLSNSPLTVDQLQDFDIDLVLYCPSCGDSYIRGVFYQSGSSYFGYTLDNNGNWSNAPGQNCNTYFKITQGDLKDGSWSGKIKFKPDPDNSYYKGPGEYSFKIGRYFPSCGSASVWSGEKIIAITGPTPTPTSSPTSTPTPTPTTKPSPTVKLTPTVKPSLTINPTTTKLKITGKVLAESTKSAVNNKVKGKKQEKQKVLGAKINFSKIFISFGLIILISCAILIILKLRKEEI